MSSAPEGRSPDPITFNVQAAVVGDQAAPVDLLGFDPYVQAIAAFLSDKSTRPPLTLSIEGDWGSGKSSFMLQLEAALRKRGKRTVTFNAWRYDKEEAMWAAFATVTLKQYSRETPLAARWQGHAKLWLSRLRLRDALPDLGKMAVSLGGIALVVGTTVATLIAGPANVAQAGSGAVAKIGETATQTNWAWMSGLAATLFAAWQRGAKRFGNPLAVDLNKHLSTPDYSSKVTFLEHFHEDFNKVLAAYESVPGDPLYVFIDDLDRCDTPRAADLLQSLHLMVSESKQLVVILGMDREKVAASIAIKHEKLVPLLTSNKTSAGSLEYGYNFIEKFVQLPFRIPQPQNKDVEKLLSCIANGPAVPAPTTESPAPTAQPAAAAAAQREDQRQFGGVRVYTAADSDLVHEVVKMVAPLLDFNPRRIKQFVNLFRLHSYLAESRGLFDPNPDDLYAPRLTPQKLGKFVALSIIFPRMLADIEVDPTMLSRLQKLVDEQFGATDGMLLKLSTGELAMSTFIEGLKDGGTIPERERTLRWYARAELTLLMAHGNVNGGDPYDPALFSFADMDTSSLVLVTAKVRDVGNPPSIQAPSANEPASSEGVTTTPAVSEPLLEEVFLGDDQQSMPPLENIEANEPFNVSQQAPRQRPSPATKGGDQFEIYAQQASPPAEESYEQSAPAEDDRPNSELA
jgi:hypothetical protein